MKKKVKTKFQNLESFFRQKNKSKILKIEKEFFSKKTKKIF